MTWLLDNALTSADDQVQVEPLSPDPAHPASSRWALCCPEVVSHAGSRVLPRHGDRRGPSRAVLAVRDVAAAGALMVRRALSVCTHPGCPALTHGGPCDEHRRIADRARGSRQQRGYDAEHERLRKQWAVKVQRGGVHCHAERCRMPARLILAGQPWDLGHTKDRTGWTGPEHAPCNRSTGGANHPSSLQVTKGGGMTPVSAGQEDPG